MKKWIITLFPVLIFGQFSTVHNAFGLDIGTRGSGIFLNRSWQHENEKYGFIAEWRLYDIKGNDETYVYNYYANQYETVGKRSLILSPIYGGGKWFPFAGKIDNNFSPFVTILGGPVFVLDGKEALTFKERWRKAETFWTYGLFVGVGVDFKMMTQGSISVNLGFDFLPLNRNIGGDTHLGGFLIHIAFNRPKK
ncbi:MAG: hypothetical protein HOG20_07460 [Candidatus Marinimicrobia bacterium]|jgi:hypothetical protein|nr:hypothetical protein [Candidatus Neomarinimicrobiota bacterium]MBT3693040.1 hypothetical protein [Candidatus Neomarinimicrobiota bacterium]MBT3732767.1 hypothetical protein [Candidatus Neomarinimicrobiota bacterium]MBT4144978.1 hypothetical protein [Candidatus Neomarinimicrobiota bacterium]MBT4178480.1 hypothetical protein [Candidatus Neomarinimicrobiota bacterium]